MDLFKSIEEDKVVDRYVQLSFDIIDTLHILMTSQKADVRQVAKAIGATEEEVEDWLSGVHDFTIRQITALSIYLNYEIISINIPNDTEPAPFEIPESLYVCHEPQVVYADGNY